MNRPRILAGRRFGFTLIEVLTSIAVLTLLIVMVSQMVSSTTLLTEGSRKHMESDGQARAVFDRLAVDFDGMVLRPDADCLFVKNTGNDKIFFYSETPAYFSGSPAPQNCSPLSLIGYRVNAGLNPPLQLERLGKGLTWAGTPSGEQGGAPVFLTFPAPAVSPSPGATPTPTPNPIAGSTLAGNWSAAIGSPPDYTDGIDGDYRVLSSGVFRFEYCFLMKDGMLSTNSFTKPHTTAEGLQDVAAIIVAIAILDDTSRKIAAPTNALVNALDDFTTGNNEVSPTNVTLMGTRWQDQINAPNFAQTTGLPAVVASKVRVYQRYYYLHTK